MGEVKRKMSCDLFHQKAFSYFREGQVEKTGLWPMLEVQEARQAIQGREQDGILEVGEFYAVPGRSHGMKGRQQRLG